MAKQTVRVRGYREFMRAAKKSEKSTKNVIKQKLEEAAGPVLVDARRALERYDVKSASGLRVRVWGRGYGVYVEQSKRRKTGRRPDYGALQMKKALLPALDKNSAAVQRRLEKGVDELCDILD